MLELSPTSVFNLDSSIRQIVCKGSFCYILTNKSIYFHDGIPRKVSEWQGHLLAAAPYRDEFIIVYADKENVILKIVDGILKERKILTKIDGGVVSYPFIALWGPEKGLLQGKLYVLREDREYHLDFPRILGVTPGGSSLYVLDVGGNLTRINFYEDNWSKQWALKVGGNCKQLLFHEGRLALTCGSRLLLLDSASGEMLFEKQLIGKKLACSGRTIINWDVESSRIKLVDIESGAERETELEPIFGVFVGEKIIVLSRWKLMFISDTGEIIDTVLLPVPLTENIALRNEVFLFSLREWLFEASMRDPNINVKLLRISRKEGAQEVEVEVKATRPSSLQPLSGARVTIALGSTSASLVLDSKGVGRATLRLEPGVQRVTVNLEGSISIGTKEISKSVVVTHDVDVPELPEGVRVSPGDILNRKLILQTRLGEGGFGTVYRARDIVTDRLVAVKIPHPYVAPEKILGEFVTEAQKMAEISRRLNKNAKNVVNIYDAGLYQVEDITWKNKGQVLAIVMEYCEKGSMRSLLEAGGIREPLVMARKLGEKVMSLNREGIVHGDLKPENILLSEDNLLLSDFYTATFLEKFDTIKRYRKLAFTEGYAPPELVERGEISMKTDVYSFAAIIVEMLTGHLPAPDSLPAPLLEMNLEPAFLKILKQALSSNPILRPEIQELVDYLSRQD